MATIKSYTDISQSKVLAKILPPESADILHCIDFDGDLLFTIPKQYRGSFRHQPELIIPAWSLSALLGLMPKLYEFDNDPDDGGCQPNLCKGWDNNLWHIIYRSSIYITEWHDEPIDAAFEMVCWLKENNKL